MCEFLWMQQCDEIQLIDENVIVINKVSCAFQFYHAADTTWLCFACYKLSCNKTYPSLFPRVHKNDLPQMNGSIGDGDKCTWKICSMKSKQEDIKLLETIRKSIDEKKNQ